MSIAPGTLFGSDFRIERPLAAGAMGEVYVAEQLSTAKARALKVMKVTFGADEAWREMFAQEARVGSRIESEHVVEVIAAGIDAASQMPWLAMELLRGTDLRHRIRAHGPLHDGEVSVLFEQICHAMGAAHRAGIVHRDLKPDNIFLAESKHVRLAHTVKILDFGIAKIVAEGRATSTGAAGTPRWMAPEQMQTGTIDARADVWALGLIAFYALTGHSYWRSVEKESTLKEVLQEVAHAPLPRASARAGELGAGAQLPMGFDDWFARCVNRDVEQRFADANALWSGLRKVLGAAASSPSGSSSTGPRGGTFLTFADANADAGGAAASTFTELPGVPASERTGLRRSRSAWALAIVVLAAASAGSFLGWRRFNGDRPRALTTIQVRSGRYYITAVRGGGVARGGGIVSTDAQAVGAGERFVLVPQPGGHLFAIRTPSGDFLSANRGGGMSGVPGDDPAVRTDATTAGPYEGFRIDVLGWDNLWPGCTGLAEWPRGCPIVSLQTPDGAHFLSAPLGKTRRSPEAPLQAGASRVLGWETFLFGEFSAN